MMQSTKQAWQAFRGLLSGLFRRKAMCLEILLFIVLAILPLVIKSPYYRDWMVMAFLWAGLASAWNIIAGYAGQLSIGHAAFFGLGAYTSALLYMNAGVSPWIGMLAGGIVSALMAAIIGVATLRLRGTFFVLATIAFTEVLRLMAIAWRSLTRGSLGVIVDFDPSFTNMTWRGKTAYIYLAFAYMLLICLICFVIERTKFGYYLIALREDEDAARALGVPTARAKMIAAIISAFLTAMGGAIYTQYLLYIEPGVVFGVMTSVEFLLIGIVGGLGTALGPVLGALLIVPLGSFLRGQLAMVSGLHGFAYGLALALVIIFMPEGVFGYLSLRRHGRQIAERKSSNAT